MLVYDLCAVGNKMLAIRKRMGMTQAKLASVVRECASSRMMKSNLFHIWVLGLSGMYLFFTKFSIWELVHTTRFCTSGAISPQTSSKSSRRSMSIFCLHPDSWPVHQQ